MPAVAGLRDRRRRRWPGDRTPGVVPRPGDAEVPAERHPAGARRRRCRHVLDDHRRLGQRSIGQHAGHPGGRHVSPTRDDVGMTLDAVTSVAAGTRVLLDPTSERAVATRVLLHRPETLAGARIGLLDISKARGNVFLDRLQELLEAGGASVRRYIKPTFTKPAPVDLRHEIATQCDVVIEALAD